MLAVENVWLTTNKCRYCGAELGFKSGTERIICKNCGRVNFKDKKVRFENILRQKRIEINKKNKGK